MVIVNKKAFFKGFVMTILFGVVLAAMFFPVFGDDNAFEASDKLFNSISKGSTDFSEELAELAKPHAKEELDMTLEVAEHADPAEVVALLEKVGTEASLDGEKVVLVGTLGQLFDAALKDSNDMFNNKGEEVDKRYGLGDKKLLNLWWVTFEEIARVLTREERFAPAKFISEKLLEKGIAVGYNYYGIQPESIKSKWLIILGALVFYVFYTLWWGFAIFFMADGIGLQLTKGKKTEH
jgi:hypothetical protein